jgi:hypothetical protein
MIPRIRIGRFSTLASVVLTAGVLSSFTAQAQTGSDALQRAPFLELTGGMITGDRVGASFESNTGGFVGGGLVFPVAQRLDLRAHYLYSNQDRRFVAFPGNGGSPGSVTVTASNLHLIMGTADVALRDWAKGKLYVSPGGGIVRNAAREVRLVDPSGASSGPNGAGNAPFASLGIGYMAWASERLGVRVEIRDVVAAGGTGPIDIQFASQPSSFPAPALAKMPVQNNVAFTLSLAFRLR